LHIALIVAGLLAVGVLTITAFVREPAQVLAAAGTCRVQQRTDSYPAGAGTR
jgi:hypothetical protein